jgi:phosphatidylglycerophosphatase A
MKLRVRKAGLPPLLFSASRTTPGHLLSYARMSSDESSNELNPVIVPEAVSVPPRQSRSPKDYLSLAIATCGVGYLPLAPGTWGSLLAVGGFLLAQSSLLGHPIDTPNKIQPSVFLAGMLIVIAVITLVGTWAASRTEQILHAKDPGKVVIDEVAGQLIAFLPLPISGVGYAPILWLIAFLLFRFFDIVKPYPARRLESLPGGLGIMADDIVAGMYAAIGVAIAVAVVVIRFD